MSHNRLSKKLVWAIKNRCTERVERLLKKRADVSNATDKNGDTAFVLACNAGSVEIIKILVKTPKIGERRLDNLSLLKSKSYAWTTKDISKTIKSKKYQIVNEDKVFYPWKLIYKK